MGFFLVIFIFLMYYSIVSLLIFLLRGMILLSILTQDITKLIWSELSLSKGIAVGGLLGEVQNNLPSLST